jgi:hypothetical protein
MGIGSDEGEHVRDGVEGGASAEAIGGGRFGREVWSSKTAPDLEEGVVVQPGV